MSVSDRSLYLKAAEELRENEGQWNAYNSRGHCVVLAGPGSGKTKTLTSKIARTLIEDIEKPRGLACITYSNECARELEERLNKLGVEASSRVFMGTVHSFSLTQIILPYAETANIDIPRDFQVATTQQENDFFLRAYRTVVRSGQDPPYGYRLSCDNYRKAILDRNDDSWSRTNPEYASVIEEYESNLRRSGLIDFDDMPILAVRALRENIWLQRAILAKYPVLFIDEYQDLGRALHAMVMGLCFSTGIRLFAVGDVDQSIYGFTGARPELLDQLSRRGDVQTEVLPFNYRCGVQIVSASQHALGEERAYAAHQDAEEGAVFFHPLNGRYERQAQYIFSTVLPQIRERNPDLELSDIAFLYPAAWIGNSLADAATLNDVQFLRADRNALYPRSNPLMRWLEQCATWCTGGWANGTPRFSVLVKSGARLFSDAIKSDEVYLEFQNNLIGVLNSTRNGELSLKTWLERFVPEVIDPLIPSCRTIGEDLAILNTLLQETNPGGRAHGMTLAQFAGVGEINQRITLSTLHSSKGREFKVVILFAVDAGRLPRSANQSTEARRLFYVGLTRAKKEVHLAYSQGNPSIFINELSQRLNT